jgi:hypothetical protein
VRLFLKYFSFVLLLLLFAGDLSAQCAMCKQTVESSATSPGSLARNLNTGILYLMLIPYLLIGFIFRKQLMSLFRKLFTKTGASN